MNKHKALGKELVIEGNSKTAQESSKTKLEVIPFTSTPETEEALTIFLGKVKDAIQTPTEDWPEGRTLELTFGFTCVPTLKAHFRQE